MQGFLLQWLWPGGTAGTPYRTSMNRRYEQMPRRLANTCHKRVRTSTVEFEQGVDETHSFQTHDPAKGACRGAGNAAAQQVLGQTPGFRVAEGPGMRHGPGVGSWVPMFSVASAAHLYPDAKVDGSDPQAPGEGILRGRSAFRPPSGQCICKHHSSRAASSYLSREQINRCTGFMETLLPAGCDFVVADENCCAMGLQSRVWRRAARVDGFSWNVFLRSVCSHAAPWGLLMGNVRGE